MDEGEFVTLLGRQLRGFHQNVLDMLVALLRKRCSQNLLGRTPFVATQSAVADRLLHRVEARNLTDLRSPGECRNRSYAGNSPEVL